MTLDDWLKLAVGCMLIVLLACAFTSFIMIAYGYFA